MKRLQLLLTLILLSSLLNSCGLFKKTTKEKHKLEQTSKEVINTKLDSAKREVITEKEVDKGIVATETTEKTTQKGTKIEKSKPLKDLKTGDNVLIDSIGTKVILMLDSIQNLITVKIETPDIETIKTSKIVEHKDKTKETSSDSETKIQKQEAIHREDKFKDETQNSTSTPSSSFWGNLGLILGISLIITIIIHLLWQNFKNKTLKPF